MKALFEFFFKDERLRWKVYVSAGGVSLVYALVNLWVLQRNEERVFSETVWVLMILVPVIAVAAVMYVGKSRAVVTEPVCPRRLPRVSSKFIVAGFVAVCFITNMLRIDVPAFQAPLANFSLARIARQFEVVQAASLSPKQLHARFQRIQSIVANSSANEVPVDASILKKTQSSLAHYLAGRPLPGVANQEGWAAAIDLRSFALRREIETGQIVPRQIAQTGYVLNSRLELDQDVHFQGEHSALFVRDEIAIRSASVTFDGIDFKGNWNPLVLTDEKADALVSDSIFEAGAQVLDRITWVNVRFQNTRILYNQGPLRLRDVSFRDCDLQDLERASAFFPIERELMRRIQEANGQPFTYIYEPVTEERKVSPHQGAPAPSK